QGLKFVEQPEHFGGAGSWEVNFPAPPELTQDYLDDVEVLAERLRKRFVREGQRGEITKVLSITDAAERIPRILMRPLELPLGLLNRLQPEFVPSLYNPSQGRMRIVLRARERQPAERKLELIRDVERVSQNWADERLAD